MSADDADKNGWRTIESAPLGERWVLLWSVSGGVDMARHVHPYGWLRFETAEYDNEGRDVFKPTHWQPLPPPPENAE